MKVIDVKNISKVYRIGIQDERTESLGSYILSVLLSPLRNFKKLRSLSQFKEDQEELDTIWAVKNISFAVNKGEVLGIIGHNGAGKSTLLKILSRITEPTTGQVQLNGRVASLLEVGTGFHPELTGRENIYLNGTLLGMKKQEVEEKYQEIVEFSGVKKFIDTPVKRYSSGMKVRLAFAVAAHLDAEILIIDEVLAVGDADFQRKCLGRMGNLADSGRTVLFVSHNLEAIKQFCQSCMLLSHGEVLFQGEPEECIDQYLRLNQSVGEGLVFDKDPALPAQFTRIHVGDSHQMDVASIEKPEPLVFRISYTFREKISDAFVLFRITTVNGISLFTVTDSDDPSTFDRFSREVGDYKVKFTIPSELFQPGTYSFIAAIYTPGNKVIHRTRLPFSFTIDYTSQNEDWFLNKAKGGFLNVRAQWELEQFNPLEKSKRSVHE
ncbi:MAG: ABC transporter ATP-binding protein [Cyclobacteriaceae bacterium]|nr:ABC transporter ATP-binding protein [Cyclobacteriaceae bacterium]